MTSRKPIKLRLSPETIRKYRFSNDFRGTEVT